jgi:hypothetical protein
MALETTVLLLEQRDRRWIVRSAALGADRVFAEAKPAIEAAFETAQRTANEGRTTRVIMTEWSKKPREMVVYEGQEAIQYEGRPK